MMAKMFYTLDEAKAALGRNEEEIKQFAREGRLREFRDGPRLMFKADQVEALKAELGGGGGAGAPRDQVDLGVSDTGAPIGLVDSQRSSGGSVISLVDTDMGSRSGTAMGGSGMPSSPGGAMLKDDTALAADLGLSGSMGGVPSPGRPGSGSGLAGSRSGINVLGESEIGADPGAQTAINASVSDQVNLEGVGSGSGLLDLTRESDDTSLGAELLDEIQPGGTRRGGSGTGLAEGTAAGGTAGGTAIGGSVAGATPTRRGPGTPVFVEAADPMAGAFGGMCLAASFMLLLAAVALFGAVMGVRPGLLKMLGGGGEAAAGSPSFFMLVLIGAGAAVIFFVFGLFIGKSANR